MAGKCPKCEFENPPDTVFCGKCGTRIRGHVPDSPESGAYPQDSKKPQGSLRDKISVTKTLETTPEGLGKGELFAGRFELIEELGAGGMGIVYRAYDKEVGEEIAVKVLHAEIARDEQIVDRFRNEIKLARRISHRHVCRMHELHQDGKQLFITMEYVSGRDLKALIKESGPLATGKAVSIAKQVVEGLAEAHELGVIHRDLKPQNIMVDKEGLAKIMDFGIARSLRTAGMTAEGMIIGTPEYMAPEQVEGLEADQRTDIYALGVILFEMVTGRVPFEGDSALSVAYKHKNEMPLPPRKLNAQVPEPFNQLILRCLEKEKENRYRTADDLLADLFRIEDGLPISERVVFKARPTIRIAREKPRGFKRFRVSAIVASALVIATAVIFRAFFYKPLPPPAPKVPNSIAIISFANLTGDKDLDFWSRGIPEGLITNLENTGDFRVTTWEQMRDIIKKMGKKDVETIDSDLGFELCRRAGIESLVTGTMRKAGDTIALDVRVLDVETKDLRASPASRGHGKESILIAQIDELSRAIAEGLGAAEEDAGQTRYRLAEMTTDSSEAWRLFVIGADYSSQVDFEKAAEYFEKAVHIDPQFAAAYCALGEVNWSLARYNTASAAFAKAKELSGRAPEKERMVIEASYAMTVEGNPEKSQTILEELIKRYPDDNKLHHHMGWVLNERQMFEDAEKEFRGILRRDPDDALAYNGLGINLTDQGEFEKAVEAFKKYIALTPRAANPWDSLGFTYIKWGKIDESIASFQEAVKIQPDFLYDGMLISYLFAFKEDYPSALDSIDRFLSLQLSPERRADAWSWKGFSLYWLGRFSESLEAFRQAEEASRAADWRWKPALFWLRFRLCLETGEFEAARQSVQSYIVSHVEQEPQREAIAVKRGDFFQGLCDLKEGRLDSARARLEELKSVSEDKTVGYPGALRRDIAFLQAEFHLAEGSVDEALAAMEKISQPPEFQAATAFNFFNLSNLSAPLFRDQRARAYARKGDLDLAVSEYERLISPDPKKTQILVHPRFYYELGKLYEEKGLKAKARRHYRRFLELWKDADPGRPEVEDARNRLDVKELH